MSGSIACYKACNLISRWVQEGHEVQVVVTRSALKFVGKSTLEGLTGRAVFVDLFEDGKQMAHINHVKWADFTILCPATANTINKLSSGLGDDLVSSLFLAHDFKKPYFIAPAMNTAMYLHPATQASIKKLESWGVKVLPTDDGRLACGDVGEGKLLDPELIWQRVQERLLSKADLSGRKLRFLITSGGTEEPIDGVRSISNFSSGRTGAGFSDYLHRQGHDVTLLRASRASEPKERIKVRSFKTFNDLDHGLKDLLENSEFDCVIHLAAVSDYFVDHLVINGERIDPGADNKFSSEHDISLGLARNYKIVDRIHQYSKNTALRLVSFKLTNNASEEDREKAVLSLLERSLADIVVHNDLSEISADSNKHLASLYEGNQLAVRTENKLQLIQELESRVLELFNEES